VLGGDASMSGVAEQAISLIRLGALGLHSSLQIDFALIVAGIHFPL
jgi:hypothetical protein